MVLLKNVLAKIWVVCILLTTFTSISSTYAGGNSSGGGSDAAAISYLDYSLPKDEKALNTVREKIEKKRSKLTDEELLKVIKKEFYLAGKTGFKKIKKQMKRQKVFVDHTGAQRFILTQAEINKAEELLEQLAGPHSQSSSFAISNNILDEKNRVLTALNWPNLQKILVNWQAWLTIEYSYKNRLDSKLLQQAIAVHEILSLHPLKIEYTNSYSVSFTIIAYHSKNASYVHKNNLYSTSDIFGMGLYEWRKPTDLNAPLPDEETDSKE